MLLVEPRLNSHLKIVNVQSDLDGVPARIGSPQCLVLLNIKFAVYLVTDHFYHSTVVRHLSISDTLQVVLVTRFGGRPTRLVGQLQPTWYCVRAV